MAIRSFNDSATQEFFENGRMRSGAGWAGVQNVVRRKLDMLNYASEIRDLRSPPGNRLEGLKGRLAGHYSIRVNDQWRIVFRWTGAGPEGVRVCDYH